MCNGFFTIRINDKLFNYTANRLHNIYKASVMKTVVEIKKYTALKDLHTSLVPKWSSTVIASPADEGFDDVPCLTNDTSNKQSCDKEDKTVESKKDINLVNGDMSVAVFGNREKGCSLQTIKGEDAESGKSDWSAEKEGKDNAMNVEATEPAVKLEKKLVKPKIVYFFERGDSLKQENEDENENVAKVSPIETYTTEASLNSKQGLKRSHDSKVI